MKSSLKLSEMFAISLMLFALFFGAGNMIFPPALGQGAGTEVWIALFGFVITGVGLPLLGVIAIALKGDINTLAGRVHPLFALVFIVAIYLCLGVFVSVPRTGTVAYEMAVAPFLPSSVAGAGYPLVMFTFIFFAVTFYLALNPSKLVGRIGKVLTPILLAIIAVIVVKALISPIGEFGAPTENYKDPLFKGFIDGYLTLDGLAALVFGNVVINTLKGQGITNKKSIAKVTIIAGIIAAFGLLIVYLSLAYLGASSVSLGMGENGGVILTNVVHHLFGSYGTLLLGVAIAAACLTTSVGIVAACGEYFSALLPKLSYQKVVFIFCALAFMVANLGLTQLNALALPILIAIYPIGIVLIILSLIENYIRIPLAMYVGGIAFAFVISFFDGLNNAHIQIAALAPILEKVPLYSVGIGWLIPAIIGMFVGYVVSVFQKQNVVVEK
ncbi:MULTISPECIES: branched-chain amino acid transport system II carrier protein BrnQ6 [Bacillus cereus group]|uniref:Branched-chain amino acid transport system carrier protein n=1 Tax=Bacillus cereus TaxID=1396 RepID=A0AA44TGN2_BACCE|nr:MULTISPECIES: branched-chain amino acid transport system II carrier protein [Bacillus cereus group]EEL49000.1 Branched-chain amino acid transport system II carrier protein [Bacillus cereus Rock3-44]PFA20947.1 branched-chain amino acid transport system II carrier protein [Bacillus cereus]PFN04916.1 branched-chain amino acid transport system II carrier protein [Bacillus cereus]PFO82126.1 branched-chain amino acid transport system II carrier protein [Bacillus cereus]PFR27942.1 branched-chain a